MNLKKKEGSSSERTDIQMESPPTKEPTVHPSKAARPKPPTKPTSPQPSPAKQPAKDKSIPETPQSTLPEMPISQQPPTKPASPQKDQPPTTNEPEPEPTKEPTQQIVQEEPPAEPQPQPTQEAQEPNVVASEATTKEAAVVEKPKSRVKHVMTKSPFAKKKRGGSVATEEGQADPMETDEEVQQPDPSETTRQKLEVRKKQKADKGKPATATSGAFIATRSASVAVSTGAAEGSSDAVASNVPEVEKAPSDPAVTKEVSDAEQAKKKAWEEAKQRLAEHMAKDAQDAPAAPTVSAEPAASSEGTAAAEGGEAEKKEKKKKKKSEQSSQLPPRQSGRLRSGALNK